MSICYLCGREILESCMVHEHVPPKQFYSPSIRKAHSPNLLTMPSHYCCNKSYEKDEVYFVHTLGPLTMDSYAGGLLMWDQRHWLRTERGQAMFRKILAEFDPRPHGLILPNGKVLKSSDWARVERVVWKIVRGLYMYEKGGFLPKEAPHSIVLAHPPEEPVPADFALVRDTPERGRDRAVFDYKYREFPNFHHFNYWALLLWDRIFALVKFKFPICTCPHCA